MPGINRNRRIIFSDGGIASLDPDAQNYVTATESSTAYGLVVNDLVNDLKTYGLWDKMVFGMLSPVTLTDTLSVVDLKTATVLSGAALKGNVDTGFRNQMPTPFPFGIKTRGTGDYILTGAVPSDIHTVNDTCIAHVVLENVAGGTKFYYSSHQSTSATFNATLRSAGNSSIIDCYTTTNNAGRNTLGGGTVTDVSGRWIVNRRSATDLELYRNGVSVGTAANGGGSLPNIQMALGAFYNGSPSSYASHIMVAHLQFSGLTPTERNNLETTLSNYETNLGNIRTMTRNLVWDGNSLSSYENMNVLRASLFYAFSDGLQYKVYNFAVPGQTTAQINADYASQIAPLYSGSYAQNIAVMWELRNSLYFGASVATVKTELDTWIAAANATGFTTVVVCPPVGTYVGNTGRTETQWNLAIDEIYAYAVANSGGADYVVQMTDPRLFRPRSEFASDGDYNTYVSTTVSDTSIYKADGTHLENLGYNLVGEMVNNQAFKIIG